MKITVNVKAADGTTAAVIVNVPVSGGGGSVPAGVTLVPIDGGQNYFDKFKSPYPIPYHKTVFPVGVWAPDGLDSATSVGFYSGICNTFVEDSYAVKDWQTASYAAGFYGVGAGTYDIGNFVDDEIDQWAGPGNGGWTGATGYGPQICTSGKSDCGYTVLNQESAAFKNGRFKYANYGVMAGTLFPGAEADAWHAPLDIVSADVYWFQSDNLITGFWGATSVVTGVDGTGDLPQSKISQASNYGRLIKQERSTMVANPKPVWSFHEICKGTSGWGPTVPQMVAGVWSAIINGARGIIWFTHDFASGEQNDECMRESLYAPHKAAVQTIYTRLQSLAPALNGPDATGLVTTTAPVDVLSKWNNSAPYVLTHMRDQTSVTATFAVKGSWSKATVLYENRVIPVTAGKFVDTFADGNTVHIYQLQ